jgi:hypothetical protein
MSAYPTGTIDTATKIALDFMQIFPQQQKPHLQNSSQTVAPVKFPRKET